MWHVADCIDKNRLHLARHAQCAGQRTAIGGHDRGFACGIHLGQQDAVAALANHFHKIFKAIAGAAVTVRLKGQDQTAARKCAAGRCQGSGHFYRVMTVIVDHGEFTSTVSDCHFAITLKAASHAFEVGQCTLHSDIFHTQLHRHSHSRQGIEHVVMPRQVQHQRQIRQSHTVASLHGETHLALSGLHVQGPNLCAFVQTISGHGPGNLVQDRLHTRIVRAHDGRAVERHAVQKLNECAFEFAQVMAVGFHVVGVDVGHHGHHRQQVQERCVRLIGLDHDVIARAQLGIGTCAVQAPTDHKRRVQPSLTQDTGHQAGGGGFAVGACNRHALLHPHQFGQHHGAGHDGDVALTGSDHLRVVGFHGRRGDHRIGFFHVVGRMPHMGDDAQSSQTPQRGAVGQVRA